MNKLTAEEIEAGLKHYTGTTQWYVHGVMRDHRYTEGVRFLAVSAGAHWLVDAVVSWQLDAKVRAEEFQVWKLRRESATGTWLLFCEDGNDRRIAQQEIAFSNFPLEAGVDLYVIDKCVLLPGEY